MHSNIRQGLALAAIGGATVLTAWAGARATRRNLGWYRWLRKSSLNPPNSAFGPVWTALYGLNALSAGRIVRAEPSAERSRALALWGTQQAFNAAWSPLFFGAHRPRAALADIGLLWASIGAYLASARRVDRLASALVVPYLGWVSFAAYLNARVVRKTPRLLTRG